MSFGQLRRTEPERLKSNPSPAAGRALRILLFFALAAYAIFLSANATSVAGGSDSSGYLNSARLLASGRLVADLRVPAGLGPESGFDRALFTPFGFRPFRDQAAIVPTYPVGAPLHYAIASKLLGWQIGPLLIEIGGALVALCLCYLIGRELGFGSALAATGAVVLGACPLFVFTSIQPLSDLLATTWTLASVWTALRARHKLIWAAACGSVFSMAVLVRPTNSVLLPALVVFLGLDWPRLVRFVAGGIPGAAWFGFYNHTLYGGALRSGYGDFRVFFDPSHVPGSLVDFARLLAVLLPTILLILPLAALFTREVPRRILAALALWFGAVIGLFACVGFSHEAWWSLRYILPAIPALILTALLGLKALADRISPPRPHVLAVCCWFIVLWSAAGYAYRARKLGVYDGKGHEQAYAEASLAARAAFPPGALVVCSATCGALYAYTDFPILRADLIDAARFGRLAALAHASGNTVGALLFESEEKDALNDHCPGDWKRIGTVKNLGLWRLGSTDVTSDLASPGPPRVR